MCSLFTWWVSKGSLCMLTWGFLVWYTKFILLDLLPEEVALTLFYPLIFASTGRRQYQRNCNHTSCKGRTWKGRSFPIWTFKSIRAGIIWKGKSWICTFFKRCFLKLMYISYRWGMEIFYWNTTDLPTKRYFLCFYNSHYQ